MSELWLPIFYVLSMALFILILCDCLYKKILFKLCRKVSQTFLPVKEKKRISKEKIRKMKIIFAQYEENLKKLASNVVASKLNDGISVPWFKKKYLICVLGMFHYTHETESAEKILFEEGCSLRKALGQDADSIIVARLMVQSNLRTPHDLHGRRRCFTMLSSYQVNLN